MLLMAMLLDYRIGCTAVDVEARSLIVYNCYNCITKRDIVCRCVMSCHVIYGRNALMLGRSFFKSCRPARLEGIAIFERIYLGDVKFASGRMNCYYNSVFGRNVWKTAQHVVIYGDKIVIAPNDR
jgi:hypothetical protein